MNLVFVVVIIIKVDVAAVDRKPDHGIFRGIFCHSECVQGVSGFIQIGARPVDLVRIFLVKPFAGLGHGKYRPGVIMGIYGKAGLEAGAYYPQVLIEIDL